MSREAVLGLLGSTAPAAVDLADLLAALTDRLLEDLAHGRTPVYASSAESGVSPQRAADLLGVSRQFVDRLIATGRLTYRHKPGSTHRLISLSEVRRFQAERERKASSVHRAIDALREGGLDY